MSENFLLFLALFVLQARLRDSVPQPTAIHGSMLESPLGNLLDASQRSTNGSQFPYLDDSWNYVKARPDFAAIPRLQDAFMSVFQRYEIALVNRQKVDEKLRNFKQVIGVDPHLHMTGCFNEWTALLVEPVFTITRNEDDLVKAITVRATLYPRERWHAQQHIRDLLQACHLFLDQFKFIQEAIEEGLGEVNVVTRDLNQLMMISHLTPADQRNLRERVPLLQNEYYHIPGLISMFNDHVNILLTEISESAYYLPTGG